MNSAIGAHHHSVDLDCSENYRRFFINDQSMVNVKQSQKTNRGVSIHRVSEGSGDDSVFASECPMRDCKFVIFRCNLNVLFNTMTMLQDIIQNYLHHLDDLVFSSTSGS
jgi:hypothetical protein